MQTLAAIASPIAAILGVLVGSIITTRNQRLIHHQTTDSQVLKDKQDACVEFLSAIRSFRRYAMYASAEFEAIEATAESKGVVTFEGRSEYDARMDTAAAKLMIIVHSDEINALATAMRSDVNAFIRLRAQKRKGNVPTQVIMQLQDNERRFARLVVEELQ